MFNLHLRSVYFLNILPHLPINIHKYSLFPSSSTHRLDSISGLMDLTLLYHLWTSATFLLFTWYMALLLFRIFITEVCVCVCMRVSKHSF